VPPRARLVTLTSDIGWAYAAQVKAALLAGGVPPDRIVDLAHDLPAHGVREAAFLLRAMARGFPAFSVHLVIVDPGVGGRRRSIAIETRAGPCLVGPDNGVLDPLARELGLRAAYRIDPGRLPHRSRVGTTFDGRDIFAPAAARLAAGASVASLGRRISPTRLRLPEPRERGGEARGEVLHVDRFGNLITNIRSGSRRPGRGSASLLQVGRRRAGTVPLVTSYEALGPGRLGILGSSFGLLEVAVGEGRASDRLHAGVGSSVRIVRARRSGRRGENANSARPRKRA